VLAERQPFSIEAHATLLGQWNDSCVEVEATISRAKEGLQGARISLEILVAASILDFAQAVAFHALRVSICLSVDF
jgi:hypothetical protein